MTSSSRACASGPVVSFRSDDLQTNRPLSIESSFAVQSRHIFLGLQLSSASWLALFSRLPAVRLLSASLSVLADAIQLFAGCLFVIGDSEQKRPRPLTS